MFVRYFSIISILLIVTFFSSPLKAQWTTNTAVNTLVAAQTTEDLRSVTSSDGYTYIAFWHNVPSPQYYEMRLQKLDTNGNPLFGTNGILIDNTISMSSYIVTWDMAIDDSNQVYIGMTGTGSSTTAIAHKISASGTKLWGTAGKTIGTGYDVKILPLSNGQVIISQYSGTTSSLQKYSANGVPLWPSPVTINPSTAGAKTIAGEMIEISGNKFEVIYYEQVGFSPYGLPYAQCYAFGSTAQWTSALALTSGVYVQTNKRYSLCKDADTVYFGFAGSVGLNIQGYIQRINPNGTKAWGANGVDFATQSSMYERDVRIAREEDSKYIWAIAEFTQSNQANVGEYVQKLHKTTGAKLLGTNAQVVFAVGSLDRSHQGELHIYQHRPVFLVSDGNSNGVFPKDIYLVHLDTAGLLNMATSFIPMGTNNVGVKTRIHIPEISLENAVAVWAENRTGSPQPYAQRYSLKPCIAPSSSFYTSTNALTATVYNTSVLADSVFWNFGDGSTSSDTSSAVNHLYTTGGTYNVCQYTFNQCGVDSLCLSVTVCLPLSAQFVAVTQADSAYFTCNWSVGDSIFWDFGDGNSASAASGNISHIYPNNGSYLVKMSIYNKCTADSSSQTIVINSNIGFSEENNPANKILFWPIPAKDVLYCKLPQILNTSQITISLYESSGKEVLTIKIDDAAAGKTLQIPVGKLAAGVYVVQFSWTEKAERIVIGQ